MWCLIVEVLQTTLESMFADQYEWYSISTMTQIETLLSILGKRSGKEIRLRDSIRKYSLLYQYVI